MKLLIPLGFLGLLGLGILLLIYLIKPNFQKKAVSSTFVWKLSLQIRKRRNPINRMRDLLLLLFQILAILVLTMIMTQPVIEAFRPEEVVQKIAVIDASASMLAQTEGENRFSRAVLQVRELAQKTTQEGGEISVIVAGENARFVSSRTTTATLDELNESLDELLATSTKQCWHGNADEKGAMKLAEQVLIETPQADVLYYTDKDYIDKGNVEIIDVSYGEEFNVAILDSKAVLNENYYDFEIELCSYGKACDVTLECYILNPNKEWSASDDPDKKPNSSSAIDTTVKIQYPVLLESDVKQTVVLSRDNVFEAAKDRVFSFEEVNIVVVVDDSFDGDNTFYLYGGRQEKIKVQYTSSIPSNFMRGTLRSLRETLRTRWDIEWTEINVNYKQPAVKGFDFYIYERYAPVTLPTDGIVMFINPDTVPGGTGIRLTQQALGGNLWLIPLGDHPIIKGVDFTNVLITESRLVTFDEDYEVLLWCGGEPAYAVKNDLEQKIVFMSFELQNSTGPIFAMSQVFYRTFNYFFPSTITKFNYEVGQTVQVNARAPSLRVKGGNMDVTLTSFPDTVTPTQSGTYTLEQTLFNKKTVIDSFFVKIPNGESNFTDAVETLATPYVENVAENKDLDLLLYFAIAIVLLLFIEWEIHSLMQ